jgi:serine/threonine protein kinase
VIPVDDDTATAPLVPDLGVALSGRYVLEDVIGSGGYARVWRANDAQLGRTVAVKIFTLDGTDRSERSRMASETRLLASLAHPNLVTLYDAQIDAEPPYLVMEFIDGPNLRDTLVRTGAFSPARTADVAAQLAGALAVIHRRGIVHRDIKPANVLLRPAHTPGHPPLATLADFGIASLIDTTRVTATGTLVGTAAYLSPEQVKGAKPATPADVYSLGLLLLEVLTGAPAFAGATPHEALAIRLTRSPEIPAGIAGGWRTLLEAMLQIEPEARPTAAHVADAALALMRGDDLSGATAVWSAVSGPVTVRPDGEPASAATDDAPQNLTALPTGAPTRPDLPPEPSAEATAPGQRRRAEAPRRRTSRWVVPAVVALIVVIGVVVVAIGFASAGPHPTVQPTMPAVPGDLGSHLQQLWTQVGG